MNNLPFITCGKTRLLNLPHAEEVIREVWDEDCYRLNEIPYGSIVLDVGAFYGEFGLICRQNKGCTVWAYEPSEVNFHVAAANSMANRIVSHYDLFKCGISGKTGDFPFYYDPDHPAGSSIDLSNSSVQEMASMWTLSSQINHIQVSFGNFIPITVKLDCEGSERGIFEDDTDWIPMVNIVTMEWHNHDGDFYANILEKHGFDVELEGGGPKPRPKWDKSIGGGYLFAKRKSK